MPVSVDQTKLPKASRIRRDRISVAAVKTRPMARRAESEKQPRAATGNHVPPSAATPSDEDQASEPTTTALRSRTLGVAGA